MNFCENVVFLVGIGHCDLSQKYLSYVRLMPGRKKEAGDEFGLFNATGCMWFTTELSNTEIE